MKTLFLLLAVLGISPAFALDFSWDHGRDRGGRADYCTASDRGWEEHWSGHSSCGECLRKHGKCVERCYEKEYRVTVTGLVRDRWNNTEREEEFSAYGHSEWDAEDRALRDCRYRDAYDCRVKSRDTENREVSSRSC